MEVIKAVTLSDLGMDFLALVFLTRSCSSKVFDRATKRSRTAIKHQKSSVGASGPLCGISVGTQRVRKPTRESNLRRQPQYPSH